MITPTLLKHLKTAAARFDDIEKEMTQSPGVDKWQSLSVEHSKLSPLVGKYRRWQSVQDKLAELDELKKDPELAGLAQEEEEAAKKDGDEALHQIKKMLAPQAANDSRNCILEIRAAVGGNESCLFAAALLRMYSNYITARGWRLEHISHSDGEVGGYKESLSRICGEGSYGRLKFESGAHRVQRVPQTESQGRVHTSVVTIAVLPETLPKDNIVINPSELRIETFRSSGAGGQHVNTTDSAVRIVHIPSGVIAECQDERSQHRNREKAMNVLKARIAEKRRRERREKEDNERRRLVGSGERSDRIRTYNFPQGRVSDHRIGLTLYKLLAVMEGDLDDILNALSKADQEDMENEKIANKVSV